MERSTIVRVHEGLHARPATRFVKLAKSFDCDVEIVKNDKTANAKSSVKLMLLSVKENEQVILRATGNDAPQALDALIDFLENPQAGLDGEEAVAQAPTPSSTVSAPAKGEAFVSGVGASEGFGLAPVFRYFPKRFELTHRRLDDDEIPAELQRFTDAVRSVQAAMSQSLSRDDLSETDRSIVAALSDIAGDTAITDDIAAMIEEGYDAIDAVLNVTEQTAAAFSRVADVYLNARADDVKAISRQLCLALAGETDVGLDQISAPCILVAEDIGAFDLARAPLKLIRGVVCAHGGATSHIAIIARSRGIPAVLGLGSTIEALADAKDAAIDGKSGLIYPDPSDEIRTLFAQRIGEAAQEEKSLQAFRDVKPRRADGTVIEVAANIGSIEEVEAAREAGAIGVGLFRTELLFMRHGGLPSEDEQSGIYSEAARAFAPHPVIIRTLDIGGDKPIAGVNFPKEENPFLGWRGVRMCLDRPDIFKPQLRALLRAATEGNIKVMLPMVSTIDEVARTRAIIKDCERELAAEGIAFGSFQLGVMIETPAAVLIAPHLAKEVDFFSIGTNDLTQYVMAADRMNPQVATLNDVANPAVMAAIEMAARAAVEAGIMVGMCGEAAGRRDLIPTFIRMGLTELSMSPAAIPRAKKCIVELAPHANG
ncbi:phosphoenolpyruvate--protein phosphotransferase [Rhizobium sp.]